MEQSKIDEEIGIISENAQNIDIYNQEELVQFVRLSIAASDRLLVHISSLVDTTSVHAEAINEMNESVSSLKQTLSSFADDVAAANALTWERARTATRISLVVLLLLVVLGLSYVWTAIPDSYRIAAISGAIGLVLPSVAKWLWNAWRM